MERTSRRHLLTVVAVSLGLIAAAARPSAAQIRIINPVLNPIPITWPNLLGNNLVEITAGFAHTCVRKGDGTVHCWGLDGWYPSTGGQIGVAPTNSCEDTPMQDPNHISVGPPVYRPCVDKPQPVTLPASATQVVAGYYHTCALTSGGTASCWGTNVDGELGIGNWTDSVAPQAVSGFQFSSLGAGNDTTCGLTSGGLFCWGLSLDDQKIYSYPRPLQITSYTGYERVVVGNRFACALFVSGSWGENDCQGLDSNGQVGVPDPSWLPRDANGFAYAPFIVGTSFGLVFHSTTQTYSRDVSGASAGYDFTCADIMDGTVQCAGDNTAGQLGNGSTTSSGSATTVRTAGGATAFHGVTTGFAHACALDANGYAWCWGLGQYGEAGKSTGFNNMSLYPQQVSTTITFSALAAGGQHTCGIGTDNNVYCWGDNEWGQLGVGYDNLGWQNFGYVTYTATPQKLGPM